MYAKRVLGIAVCGAMVMDCWVVAALKLGSGAKLACTVTEPCANRYNVLPEMEPLPDTTVQVTAPVELVLAVRLIVPPAWPLLVEVMVKVPFT